MLNRSRLVDIESELLVTKGETRDAGEDEPGAWDEAEEDPEDSGDVRRHLRSLTAKLPWGGGVERKGNHSYVNKLFL